MTRSILRPLAATALAAALVLAAVPAAAAAPADDGSVVTTKLEVRAWLNDWIDRLFAASEAGPGMEPNGAGAAPEMDPDGLTTEAGPGMDPDGTESDAGPHMDPNG